MMRNIGKTKITKQVTSTIIIYIKKKRIKKETINIK